MLLAGTAFIVVNGFSGTEISAPNCDASWKAFFFSLTILTVSIAVVEVFRWIIWRVREQSQAKENVSNVSPSSNEESVTLRTTGKRGTQSNYVKFAVGGLLFLSSLRLGPPDPCRELRLDTSILSTVVGNLAFVCGLLLLMRAELLED